MFVLRLLTTLANIHQFNNTAISHATLLKMIHNTHSTHSRVALADTYKHSLTLLLPMILHRTLANMQIHSNIATIQPSIAKTTDGTLPCAIENVASIVIQYYILNISTNPYNSTTIHYWYREILGEITYNRE